MPVNPLRPVIDAGIIDANIFLRYVVYDQPAQAEQVEVLFDQIALGEVAGTVLPTVFLEIVFVLERQYRFPRDRIADALYRILAMSKLNVVDHKQLIDATSEYRNRVSISFADAYHCAMARDFHNGSIVSFDRKLGSVPGVFRHDPDTI